MDGATVFETSHKHPKTHDGDGSENHRTARKSRTRASATAKKPKRHAHTEPLQRQRLRQHGRVAGGCPNLDLRLILQPLFRGRIHKGLDLAI